MSKGSTHPALAQRRAIESSLGRLDRMTSADRLSAARRGKLDRHARAVWAARFPEEVPLVNGEVEWIALTSADLD